MKYFITGVTGTLGTEVATKLLAEGHEVIGFSRDECKQAAYFKHPKLTLYLGDIRDRDRLVEATRGTDLIFHFAALKHVDLLEENPEESIQTNVFGTENVLHAQRMNQIPRVLMASTDKAAYPINVYGMSKGIAEKLVLRNAYNVVCRYGNVLASRGSVVEKLVKTLKTEQAVYLTDPNMTRFWITANEASDFVISSSFQTGGLRIPVMKAASLSLLANAIAQVLAINSYKSNFTGFRAGEKMHECLKTTAEGEEVFSHLAPQYTENQLIETLRPIVGRLSS